MKTTTSARRATFALRRLAQGIARVRFFANAAVNRIVLPHDTGTRDARSSDSCESTVGLLRELRIVCLRGECDEASVANVDGESPLARFDRRAAERATEDARDRREV